MRPDNQANVFATRAVQALAAPAAALYDRRLLQATSPRPLLATFIHLAAMARTCSHAQLLQLVHDGAIDRAVDLIKQALPDGTAEISATAVRLGLAKIEAMNSIAPDGALWLAALQLLAVVATRGDPRVRAECARRGAVGACVLVLRQFLRALERAAAMQQRRTVAGVGSKRPLDDRDRVADDRDQDAGGMTDHDMDMDDDSMRKKTDRKCTVHKQQPAGANGHATAGAAPADAHQIRARTVAPSPLKRQCVASVASGTSAATRVALVATTSFNLNGGVRAVGGDGGRAIEGGAYTTRLPQPGAPSSAARAPTAAASLRLAEDPALPLDSATEEDGSPSSSSPALRILPQPIIISPRPLSPASASLSLPGAAPVAPVGAPGMGHVDALLALQVIQVLAENPTVRAYLRQPQGLAQQQLQQQSQQPAPPNAVGVQLCAFALVEPFTRLPIAPLRDVAVQIMRQAAAAGAVNAGKCGDASCRTPTTTTTTTSTTTTAASTTALYTCSNLTCARVECVDGEFARCGRCRAARYCSRACQAASWTRGHRHWCAGTACSEPTVGKNSPTGAAVQAPVWQQQAPREEEREEEEEKEKEVESRRTAAVADSRTASAAALENMVVVDNGVVDDVRRVVVPVVGPVAGVVAARVHGGHHHAHHHVHHHVHHHHGHVVLGGTRFGMPVSFRATVPAAPVSPVLVANLGMPKHGAAAAVVPTMAL
ncbi:hypothetical protein GGF31_006537 [Allomyces arbusculus]|nr:hypothetical protein GGF31_006537 [Allomyces arbusculus]